MKGRTSTTFTCDPIEGTIKLRSIVALSMGNMTQLFAEPLACLSVHCSDRSWEVCENVPQTGLWVSHQLQLDYTKFVRELAQHHGRGSMHQHWTLGTILL